MFPQARKWPSVLAGIVVLILVYRDPAGAAHLVSGAFHAINTFASSLH